MRPARLVLEDGSVFEGEGFASETGSVGEVVFNTSSTGYQEILTDPSYSFQIVVMTSPHIGNYGLSDEITQSERPQVAGFVVRELSNDRAETPGETLSSYLDRHGVAGIEGVDTRALTRAIREAGAVRGIIVGSEISDEAALKRIADAPSMHGADLVRDVTRDEPTTLTWSGDGPPPLRFALYDYGVKRRIASQLAQLGEVTIYPATTPAETLLADAPDGVVLSNGPGDPEPVTYAQENIRKLIGKVPILGICLGHQLLGIALGGKTHKLKFGHHGGNHPVRDLQTGRVEITAQNHGFSVDPDSLPATVEPTHINLNDGTLEGFRHREEPIVAIQFHPEAAPGPNDSLHVFRRFGALVAEHGS